MRAHCCASDPFRTVGLRGAFVARGRCQAMILLAVTGNPLTPPSVLTRKGAMAVLFSTQQGMFAASSIDETDTARWAGRFPTKPWAVATSFRWHQGTVFLKVLPRRWSHHHRRRSKSGVSGPGLGPAPGRQPAMIEQRTRTLRVRQPGAQIGIKRY
jgi:hypothetical protein